MRLYVDRDSQLTERKFTHIHSLLNACYKSDDWLAMPLPGCGSDRRFFRLTPVAQDRLTGANVDSLVAVLPAGTDERNLAEARSSFRIGRHLHERGVAVPEIFGFEPASGLLVFEDLGDCRLHDLLCSQSPVASAVIARYHEAVQALVTFQVHGRQGFQEDMCWDTPRYDQDLMLKRESLYFAREFCQDMLGFPEPSPELLGELAALAERVSKEPADFLLHRDFQSQNLMIHQDRVRIVDFQGARLGPLGYDLASLLNDPYAGLSADFKEELLCVYLNALQQQIKIDPEQFRQGYYYLALQRNLQVLGAYAFLSLKKGKTFFSAYILPAAQCLQYHLQKAGDQFPRLTRLVAESLDRLTARESKP